MTDEFKQEMAGLTEQLRAIAQEHKGNVEEFRSLKDKCAELDSRMAELAEYQARCTTPSEAGMPTEEQVRGLQDFMTRGVQGAQENNGPSGGYFVAPEIVNQVMKKLYDIDVFRQFANVVTIGSNAAKVILNTGLPDVQWVGETESRTKDKGDYFGVANIGVYDEQITYPVSRNLLEDGGVVNFESFATGMMADALEKGEGAAFVNGDGHDKPEGLFKCDKIKKVTSTSSTVAADDFIDLWADTPTSVDDTGAYYVSKPVMAYMRKLKDQQGQYLWQTPISAGAPATFNGYPVRVLASAEGTISGGKIIAGYGALDKTYTVVERNSMFIMRDEYTSKARNMIEFTINRRVGGGVAMPDNFRLLKVHS